MKNGPQRNLTPDFEEGGDLTTEFTTKRVYESNITC